MVSYLKGKTVVITNKNFRLKIIKIDLLKFFNYLKCYILLQVDIFEEDYWLKFYSVTSTGSILNSYLADSCSFIKQLN